MPEEIRAAPTVVYPESDGKTYGRNRVPSGSNDRFYSDAQTLFPRC